MDRSDCIENTQSFSATRFCSQWICSRVFLIVQTKCLIRSKASLTARAFCHVCAIYAIYTGLAVSFVLIAGARTKRPTHSCFVNTLKDALDTSLPKTATDLEQSGFDSRYGWPSVQITVLKDCMAVSSIFKGDFFIDLRHNSTSQN